jgi:SAM-dependent methyltransferase
MTIAPGTHAFYVDWAATGQESPRSAISLHFESAFAPGARVLDVGCGMGRDLAVLREMGFDAYGIEPHDAMRSRAIERHPQLAGRIAAAALPQIGEPFGGGFDGIVCSAVLMHVTPDALPASLVALNALLVAQARVLMAVPEMDAHLLADGHDQDGRAFANHAPEHVQALMAELGFELANRTEVTTPSMDTRWRILLFER